MHGPAMENVESVYPLSAMQQSILLRVLMRPGSGEYVEQVAWTLEGAFDADAFARAWRVVMERHAVLRTAFFWEWLERPLQVVRTGRTLALEHHDWRALPAGAREAELERFLAADRLRGFDPTTAPLMRVSVIRLDGDATGFVWSYHHLLLDGWSAALCLRDLFAAYEALCTGSAPRLGRARPFESYLAWAAAQDPAAGEAFWRGVLDGFEGAPAPGVARPGAREGERYGVAAAVLEPALVDGLNAAARRHQLTLNTLLQGAWGALLAGYTGEADVVFGAVAAGRLAAVPGVDSIPGVFINTLPVRVRMRPGEPAAAWLQGLQAEQLRARPHEHWSMPQVAAWSGVPHGRRLFETMFVFQNLPD
ncbi:MAG TPA: condensation domain-containing protein, partial [Longimicrobiaceae bacterium]|nr:condensation domain-containing protein [Longimicrobiaceae bacterium]